MSLVLRGEVTGFPGDLKAGVGGREELQGVVWPGVPQRDVEMESRGTASKERYSCMH